jgi:hypothetical protein
VEQANLSLGKLKLDKISKLNPASVDFKELLKAISLRSSSGESVSLAINELKSLIVSQKAAHSDKAVSL